MLIPGSNEIHTIKNVHIYDTYKDLYLNEKEREQKAVLEYTISELFKRLSKCKEGRWYSNNSYNSRKCSQKRRLVKGWQYV